MIAFHVSDHKKGESGSNTKMKNRCNWEGMLMHLKDEIYATMNLVKRRIIPEVTNKY